MPPAITQNCNACIPECMLLLKNKYAAIKSEHDSKGNLIKVSHLSYSCVTLPSLLAK